MTSPDERPGTRDVAPGGSYSIHPLSALDGVMLYVTLNGEAIGSYFGATEEAAAEALAEHLAVAASTSPEGNAR
jgi:hypothetical protein